MNRLEEQLRAYMIEDALISLYRDLLDEEKGKTGDQVDPFDDDDDTGDDNSGISMFDTAETPALKDDGSDWVDPVPTDEPESSGGSDKPKGGTKPTGGSDKPKGGTKPTETPAPPTSPPPTGGDTPSTDDEGAEEAKEKALKYQALMKKKLPRKTRFAQFTKDYATGLGGALGYNIAGKAYADMYRSSGIDSGARMGPEFTDIGPKSMNVKGVQQIARGANPFRSALDAAQASAAERRTQSRAQSYEKLRLGPKEDPEGKFSDLELSPDDARKRAEKDIQTGLLRNFAKSTGDLEDSDLEKLISKAVEKRLIQRQQRVA